MRSNCSPNHLKSPLLHSYVTGSFPRNYPERQHDAVSSRASTVSLCLSGLAALGGQQGVWSPALPSIGLALPVLSPHIQGGCLGCWRGPRGAGCWAGGRGRPRGTQWSPLQLYHPGWGGLLVAQQNLGWRGGCGPIFRTPGPMGWGVPRHLSAHQGQGLRQCRVLSWHSAWRRGHPD